MARILRMEERKGRTDGIGAESTWDNEQSHASERIKVTRAIRNNTLRNAQPIQFLSSIIHSLLLQKLYLY